jgi:hypothetical protein
MTIGCNCEERSDGALSVIASLTASAVRRGNLYLKRYFLCQLILNPVGFGVFAIFLKGNFNNFSVSFQIMRIYDLCSVGKVIDG